MSITLRTSVPRINGVARLETELLEVDSTLRIAPLPTGREDHPQIGVLVAGVTTWPLRLPDCDQLCYFLSGQARFGGLEARAGTVLHLKRGWEGAIEVLEPTRFVYVTMLGSPGESRALHDAPSVPAEKDWGVIPTMLEGESRASGILLSRDPDGRAESGLWICTPGYWGCHVTGDEFCHFLSGRCTYTAESGETIEIEPDTTAFFPKDWRGTCRVHETVRKVYMIA